jgi:hypothetical protein
VSKTLYHEIYIFLYLSLFPLKMQDPINLHLKAALCLEERRNATPTPDL